MKEVKILWYNTVKKIYEFGSRDDFKMKQLSSLYPEQILDLEEFTHANTNTLMKITSELNKCQFDQRHL